MKFWEDFYNEVMPYVENCPAPIIKHQLINAAIEFCQRSGLWRRQMDQINITANIYSYNIMVELSNDEAVSNLDYAYITETSGETKLFVTTEDTLEGYIDNWRTKTAPKPTSISMEDAENFRLYPIPEADILNSLVIGLILKPSRNSAGLPDWIHEQWAEKIAHGAKAKLFGMKSRSWYDKKEALNEQDSFDLAIKDATIRTNKGNSRTNLKLKMRPMA